MNKRKPDAPGPQVADANIRPSAVIDIGATSIRMAIAEIHDGGQIRTLETLAQAVNLGKDSFTQGAISKTTIEECVRVLKSYGQMLKEYQIDSNDRLRVVATSAVREASNRLAFLDRVYIATGLEIEPIDEAEVNRLTYLGVEHLFDTHPALMECQTLVTEVSGGSTETLLVRTRNVVDASTFRMGSLRFRKSMEPFRAPELKVRNIMESQIDRMVRQITAQLDPDVPTEMIALGSDMRFAATQILPDWNGADVASVPLSQLESLTDDLLSLSEEDIVRRYHLSFPDAELVVPALLIYVQLAKGLGLDQLLVTDTSLRDGLFQEMAGSDGLADQFRQQIIRSAVTLGRKFAFDEKHALHVAELAKNLFHQLEPEHQLAPRNEIILYLAGLLHEIGLFVSSRSLHKHTMYLINNSELFGIGKTTQTLLALVARYHRRASPQSRHEGFAALKRDQRILVSKLAAILRVAVALDESRSGRIRELQCGFKHGKLIISVPNVEDLSLEQLALRQNASLFGEVFGREVVLESVRN